MAVHVSLHSSEISCDHCAMTIKRELGTLAGVVSVKVDVASKTIEAELADDGTLVSVEAALEEIGYPVSS